MKITEFRRLIREEVSKVLKEQKGTLNNVEVSTTTLEFLPLATLKKLFGSFLVIKQGPSESEYTTKYTVDLSVDALVSLLKSNKDYSTLVDSTTVDVYYKGNDNISINKKSLPTDVVSTLEKVGFKNESPDQVVIQISDPADDFGAPDDYSIPTIVQSIVGKPTFSSAAEDNTDVYDREKVEAALLAVGKKVVPGLKKYTIEDGAIIFEIPGKATPNIKAKLKKVYQGAKSVEF